MYRQVLLSFVLFVGMTNTTYANPSPSLYNIEEENLTIREALSMAMRQQTLSQRIAKIYFALNNNLYEPKFYQERDQAIEMFDEQLEILKSYAPTDKVKQAIRNVRILWVDYKKVASWSINTKGALQVLEQCDNMLLASNHLVYAYEEYAQELGELYKNSELSDIVKLIIDDKLDNGIKDGARLDDKIDENPHKNDQKYKSLITLKRIHTQDFYGLLRGQDNRIKNMKVTSVYSLFFRFSTEKLIYFIQNEELVVILLQYLETTRMLRVHQKV